MDRTRRLLMSVTASALLAGGGGTTPGLPEARAATTDDRLEPYYNPQGEQAKITEVSQIISSLLAGVQEENAMSLNELIERRPDLNRRIAGKAIEVLLRQGRIKKTGDGTKDKPFRYYDQSRSGHGG